MDAHQSSQSDNRESYLGQDTSEHGLWTQFIVMYIQIALQIVITATTTGVLDFLFYK